MTQPAPQPRRPRLLVVTSTLPRHAGDTEPAFVLDLCKRLAVAFNVRVLAPSTPEAAREEVIDGVSVLRYPYFFNKWQLLTNEGGILAKLKQRKLMFLLVPFFLMGQWLAIRRQMRTWQPDIIHAHWLIPQGLIAALQFRGVQAMPLVCTSHGGDVYGLRGRVWDRIRRAIMRHCTAVVVVSQAMQEKLSSTHGDQHQTHVIPMGIDARETFLPPAGVIRKENVLLFVGRLVQGKGLENLLKAMPQIRNSRPDLVLRVVGSGPEETRLKQLSEELGIQRHVSFEGAMPNTALPTYYQRATLFIAPFVGPEGLGLVSAEALACGCPVVASALPAVREVVIDGSTGLLAKPGDSDDLAAKILYLLDHPEERQALAERGRQHVLTHFDWEVIAERYRELLLDLINLPSRS